MLNCCIHHKLSHQQKLKTPNIKTRSSGDNLSFSTSSPSSSYAEFHTPSSSVKQPSQHAEAGSGGSSSEEDEFYEALEDVLPQTESGHEASEMEVSESDNQLSGMDDCNIDNQMPPEGLSGREGVLKQYGNHVLIATGQPLCIPITQVSGQCCVCMLIHYSI